MLNSIWLAVKEKLGMGEFYVKRQDLFDWIDAEIEDSLKTKVGGNMDILEDLRRDLLSGRVIKLYSGDE